ncbi:helix-turn-helix domain-containing protein [Streptomyces flaveolus]|uniref:helix-turn-helix domain-containing protein n=1 Tax=Streptomyces flaveolus TaxID=67297 RepID=UPI0036FF9EE6
MAGDDFAGLLQEFKERSGLSYGALGKRLHMSASTVHRYVSGEVVPVEFAPVERLARVCRATPEELLELHRRWIRADALRGVKKGEDAGRQAPPAEAAAEDAAEAESAGAAGARAGEGSGPPDASSAAAASAPGEPSTSGPGSVSGPGSASGSGSASGPGSVSGSASAAGAGAAWASAAGGGNGSGSAAGAGNGSASAAGAGAAWASAAGGGNGSGSAAGGGNGSASAAGAGAGSASAAGAGAGSASAAGGGNGSGSAGGAGNASAPSYTLDAPSAPERPAPSRRRRHRTALYAATGVVVIAGAVALVANLVPGNGDGGQRGPAGAVGAAVSASAPVSGTASRPASPSASASASASATASPSPSTSASASATATRESTAAPSRPAPAGGPALTVATTPYFWDSPCDHAFLVDRSPQNVLPPPPQQDAVGWATAYGAVSANRQTVVLTVQGTGQETVVLQDLHVRVVSSKPALDWNQYVMGNGCGGGVDTASFDVSLDLGTPLAMPVAGQRDFPYKVTESDPEVFHVKAHTSGHDVSWYLELEWSSGERQGTLRIDDHGKPFRTSASKDASYYAYPLGSHAWEWVEGT